MSGDSPSPLRTHRFALSICGGVALGAYEAGVVSQLYKDIHDFNAHADIEGKARVSIDAISGASAGSITGLILAQGIGLGLPPDEIERLLRLCWIELLDIRNLLSTTDSDSQGCSIFSDQVISTIINQALQSSLSSSAAPDTLNSASESIALWLTMTNLDGVPYVINFNREDHAQPDAELYALDYKDYVPFVIYGDKIEMVSPRMVNAGEGESGGGAEAGKSPDSVWSLAANAARASSAFPVAFPPSYQSRDLTQYPEYMEFRDNVEAHRLASGVGNLGLSGTEPLPTTARFQFADGGLFSNLPIGRCIDAVAHLNRNWPDRDPDSPESQGMAGRSFVVFDPVPQTPADVEALLTNPIPNEADASLPTAIVGKILAAYFNTAVYADLRTAEETNRRIRSIRAALSKLDVLGLPVELTSTLKSEIISAAGLDGKSEITLQRIPSRHGVRRTLAGDFAGHFGGFFRTDYREADFITGRSEARSWFIDWLTLWLKDHAPDIGKCWDEINPGYVASLLKAPPPNPAEEPIPPTELTPEQLGSSNWFPNTDEYGKVAYTDRLAALNNIQRREIVELAQNRLLVLLQSWFHVPAILARPETFILNRFVGPKLIDEPVVE